MRQQSRPGETDLGPLHNAQQALSKPSQHRRLSFQTIDLSCNSRRQDGVGSVAAESPDLVPG
jgi:hypothetical protein